MRGRLALAISAFALALASCVRPAGGSSPWTLATVTALPIEGIPASAGFTLPPARDASTPYLTPTPDAPRALAPLRADAEYYAVQPGDNLAGIALEYNLDLGVLIAANTLLNPNVLEIGQVITIPAQVPSIPPSDFKIIPDSELVYGPVSSTLNVENFVRAQNGYLAGYREDVEEISLTGAQIVQRISYEYSVNPRLLLAMLEYRSGWVTSARVGEEKRDYPMRIIDEDRKGLYKQLAFAANQLNRGYYLWKINALSYVSFGDSGLVMLAPTLNAGTAAVQYAMGVQSDAAEWQAAVSESGVFQTYVQFFGIPFDLTIEPLMPAGLTQPKLALPFERDVTWYFTSGPHGGWGDGSAWAAVDFAPQGEVYGCYTADDWVTASAAGVVVRSGDGAVVLDLDGDGLEQTGWTILYMHIESRDRIPAGSVVETGDRIGHPSCEGGYSTGTHLHIARRYNGEWIAADVGMPFLLSGWLSSGDGTVYSGTFTKDGAVVYSLEGRFDANQIQR